MATLVISSFERRLLQMVKEELATESVHDWPEHSHQLCLEVLRKMRENAATMRPVLEDILGRGVEARSFVREYSPLLSSTNNHLAGLRELVEAGERLSAEHAEFESMAAEFRRLEQETQAFRDFLAEAIAQASKPPRPIDWDRVRQAEQAYARGETKPFSQR